jgi:hypothetical protein
VQLWPVVVYCPSPQLEQEEAESEVPDETVPAGQPTHVVTTAYVPAAHWLQSLSESDTPAVPVEADTLPAGQSVQLLAIWLEYDPAAHGTHAVAESLPSTAFAVPAAQMLQSSTLSWLA